MNKRMYWGFGILIILILGATIFLLIRNQREVQQIRDELEVIEKRKDNSNVQKESLEVVEMSEVDNRPALPDDGHKIVWHDESEDRQHIEITRDRQNYTYYINGVRYTIKLPETPAERAKLKERAASLEKKAREIAETNKQLAIQINEVAAKLKAEHSNALKIGDMNRKISAIGKQTREITSMLRSGEITPLEAMQRQRQIDESLDAQAVKSYLSTIKEVDNESN